MTLKNLLSKLWNCPNTLLGLFGAIGGTRYKSSDLSGVLKVSGGWLIRVLACGRWASAITLGDVILYEDAAHIPILHAHEMVHVKNIRFEVEAFRAGD